MSESGDRSGGSNKYEKCVARTRNDHFSKIRGFFQQKQTSVEFIKCNVVASVGICDGINK